MIYIQNTLGGDVAAFDETDGDREVARFSPGDELHPDSIVLSADGSTLHMNASNRFQLWNEPEALARSKFYGLDAKTLELKWSVDLPGQIEHFAASPDKRYVYNAHYDRKVVSEVDTQTRSVKLIKITDMGGHKVRCTADGKKVYVGSMIWASLDEIDRETGAFTRRMTFDDNVRPFALSKDGKRAYVQLNRMHGFHVVDLVDMKIVETVKGPGLKGAYPGHEAHYPFTCDHGIEITPDEKFLITLATTGNFICVYNYPSLKLVTTIETDTQPSYLTVSKDSRWCYVSCRVSGTVHVYDLKSLKLNRTLKDVGVFPQRVCVDH
ncbi:MAG: YncE family protein [Oceanicaulis sp.]